MEARADEWPEALFEIVWYQHNPDDWVAEVVNLQTGEHRLIMTTDELAQFVQPHARLASLEPLEPKPSR